MSEIKNEGRAALIARVKEAYAIWGASDVGDWESLKTIIKEGGSALRELEAENKALREGLDIIANIACRAVGGKTEDYICSRNLQSDIQKEVNRINELLGE